MALSNSARASVDRPGLGEQLPQVVVGLRVAGPDQQGVPVVGLRLGQLAEAVLHHQPAPQQRLRHVGIGGQRDVVLLQRLLRPSGAQGLDRQVVVDLGGLLLLGRGAVGAPAEEDQQRDGEVERAGRGSCRSDQKDERSRAIRTASAAAPCSAAATVRRGLARR